VTRVYAGGLSFTNAHGNPSHESGVAIDDLIPELKHLPKRKRRRVTDRAFTRALHPFHYFAMLGAAAFGALVMQPFRHIAPVWLILTVSVLCGMVAGVMVIHRVVRNAERLAREDLGIACPRCGYDIRGSAWRCPECGEAFR
jgi:DNA-directed RNA polymerase subunit RPC12/RpoP